MEKNGRPKGRPFSHGGGEGNQTYPLSDFLQLVLDLLVSKSDTIFVNDNFFNIRLYDTA